MTFSCRYYPLHTTYHTPQPSGQYNLYMVLSCLISLVRYQVLLKSDSSKVRLCSALIRVVERDIIAELLEYM